MSSNSSTGQILGYVVGAVVGYFTGGTGFYPTLAAMGMGASVGGAIGGAIDPPKGPLLVGPRLNDLSVQTSTYGATIPRVYGTVALMGNIFWLENNRLRERKKTESQGGKGGGGGAEVKTYSYYATFAVGLCEGPIVGVRRIWVGSKLIYDAGSGDIESVIASNEAATLFTVHNGSDTQLPDDRMQATLGVANTPAYRGLAYIVLKDYPLKDHGNSLLGAQVKVEVVSSGAQTSHLISDFSIPESPSWYFSAFKNAGNQMDYDGLSNYIVAANSYPLWIQTINEKIVKQTVLTGPAVYPVTASVMPLTTSLDRLQYAFVTSNDYFAWGANGSIDTLQIAGSSPYILAESNNVIYITWLIGGTYHIGRLDGVVTSQSDMGLENPAVAVWGGFAVTAYRENVVDPLTIRVFEEVTIDNVKTIVQQDYYTLSPGIVGDFTLTSETKSIYVSDNKLYIVTGVASGSGHTVEIKIIDLIGKSLLGSYEVDQYFPAITTSERPTLRVIGDLVFYGQRNVSSSSHGFVHNAWQISRLSSSTVNLSEIILAECLTSNILDSSDIDVSEISQEVRGYRVSSVAAIRSGIEPLQGAWPFDVIQAGYKIKFKPRGGSVVATIPAIDLDCREAGKAGGVSVTSSREMDSILPARVVLKHIDLTREYDQGEQYSERLNTSAVNTQTVEMPIVMTSAEAAANAEMLLYLYWLERHDVSFSLPPIYNSLEPGDVITVNAATASYELRLTAINYTSDGRLECSAKYNSAAIYSPTALGEEGQSTGAALTLAGSTAYELLDIPLLLDATDMPGFPVAMTGYRAGWPGGILYRTDDAGQTWASLQSFIAPGAVIGRAGTPLAAGRLEMIDKAGVLAVSLISGELSSVTEAAMLGGSNHFAYGVHGRWEIIAAQNCTLQGDGSYVLTDLLRGRFGSEYACASHVAGDSVVLLDSNTLSFVTANLNTIGASRTYRGITAGKDMSTDSDKAFTYTGVNLECLAPVYLNGNRHPSTNDWSLDWIRRTRVGGEWRDYVDATMGETAQSYEVEIYSSAAYTTIKRTISGLTAPAATYSSANQVTDFGSNQATLYVKVYQLSTNVGRGYPLTTSITR